MPGDEEEDNESEDECVLSHFHLWAAPHPSRSDTGNYSFYRRRGRQIPRMLSPFVDIRDTMMLGLKIEGFIPLQSGDLARANKSRYRAHTSELLAPLTSNQEPVSSLSATGVQSAARYTLSRT